MNSTCVDSSLPSALIPRPHLNPQTTLEETMPELIALPIVSHPHVCGVLQTTSFCIFMSSLHASYRWRSC